MEEKKEKAIEAARDCFHERGYNKTSLTDLISEIGVSKSTFYNYFKNKEELFLAVLKESCSELHYQYAVGEKDAANAMQRLEVYIKTFESFLAAFPLFKDLYAPGNDLIPKWAKSRQCGDFFLEGINLIRSILEQGIEEGVFSKDLDLEKVPFMVFYILLLTLSTDPKNYQTQGSQPHRTCASDLLNLLGKGLLAR